MLASSYGNNCVCKHTFVVVVMIPLVFICAPLCPCDQLIKVYWCVCEPIPWNAIQ